ncbi:MAG: ABC transporter permease [Proteobacteria bacterium]|nr:ABC transporter permease [Pseudomonadota bacterium]
MIRFILGRLLSTIPTVFFAASAVFFCARILPGDPAIAILGDAASQEAINTLREKLGLDQPLMTQYGHFLTGVLRGDLGNSMVSGHSVVAEVADVFPYTLELTIFAIGFGVLFGVPLGIVAALRSDRLPDYVARVISLVGLSCPAFFIGICFILAFSIYWPIFPVIGSGDVVGQAGHLKALIPPGITLGITFLAFVARSARTSVMEVLPEQFVRTARMKGIDETKVILGHVLRNALLPIITVSGLYFGILLGNAVITEVIFTRPGLGKLIIGALNSRDYVLLQGLTIIYCVIVVVVGLATDLISACVDPRLKLT